MLRTTARFLKLTPPIELLSLYHALVTLVITAIAFAVFFIFPSPNNYWLMLASILLSQVGLRNEQDSLKFWPVFYYLLSGFISAALVFLLTLTADSFWLSTVVLLITTFITSYKGWLNRKFFLAGCVINFLSIIAAFAPADFTVAAQRFYLIMLASCLVFSVRLLFFLYQRHYQFYYAKINFLQKMKQLYGLIFYNPSQPASLFTRDIDESHFQSTWSDCLSLLQTLKKKAPPAWMHQMERIWDITLSLASLRYRLTDASVLSIVQEEWKQLLTSITDLFNQLMKATKSINLQPLNIAIQRLEELNQGILQTMTKEPLVLLLFIQDLHALKEQLKNISPPFSRKGEA